jgi:hypothetical protein
VGGIVLLDHETLDGIKQAQRVRVKCDRCGETVEKIVQNLLKQRKDRNGEDVCKRCATIEYNKTRPEEIRKRSGEGYKLKHKGKKLEEIVGKDKAEKMKQNMSLSASGSNNANFGGKYSRGFADNPLTGSWSDRYGEDIANERKLAMSNRTSGEGNPMYGKPAPKKSGNGISGYYRKFYFRSLLELSYMLKLDSENIEYVSCESTRKRFVYELDGVNKTYFPDFFIPSTNTYIEIKPSQMLKNREVNVKAKAVIDAGEKFSFVTQRDMIKIKKPELLDLISKGIVTIDKGKQKWVSIQS